MLPSQQLVLDPSCGMSNLAKLKERKTKNPDIALGSRFTYTG